MSDPGIEVGQLRFIAGRGVMRIAELHPKGNIRCLTHDGCSYWTSAERVRGIPTEGDLAFWREQHVTRGLWEKDYTPTWREYVDGEETPHV